MGTYPDSVVTQRPFRSYTDTPEIPIGGAIPQVIAQANRLDRWVQPLNNMPCYGIDGSNSQTLTTSDDNKYRPFVQDTPQSIANSTGTHILGGNRDPHYRYYLPIDDYRPLCLELRTYKYIIYLRATVSIAFGYPAGVVGFLSKRSVSRAILIAANRGQTYEFDFQIAGSSVLHEGTLGNGPRGFNDIVQAVIGWSTITGRYSIGATWDQITFELDEVSVTDSGATNNAWHGGCSFAPGGAIISCSPNGGDGNDASGSKKPMMPRNEALFTFYNDILRYTDPSYVQLQPQYPVTYGPAIGVSLTASALLTANLIDYPSWSYDEVDPGSGIANLSTQYVREEHPELVQMYGVSADELAG